MKRLDIIEKEFKIKIPHINETDPNKPDIRFDEDTLDLIRETHKEFYHMIDFFDENNFMTYQQWRKNK
jgi:hypothetical protein